MADRVQLRRDTAANWTAYNPILLEGEIGLELDTDQYKLGDGIHTWSALPYRGAPCVQQMGSSTTTPMSQKAVTDIFNSLRNSGYLYAGLATSSTNPGTPTEKVFYVALEAGTYTNFGNLVVTQGINFLKYNGTAWSQEQLIGIDDTPTENSNKLPKSSGTFTTIQNSPQVGYFECNTAAATAAKTVTSDNYILPTIGGGSIKIKMTNANTAASGVTLKIGSAEAKPLYYAGQAVSASNTWQAGETVEVYYDGTNYQANNVAGGGGSGDGVYDISEAHSGTTYADLAAALGTNGANVPANVRQGGMSVKFVNSTSGKYEQWRYMGTSVADADFVVVTNWQGVDDVPTAGSNNLVTSGAVAGVIGEFTEGSPAVPTQEITGFTMTDKKYISPQGVVTDTALNYAVSSAIDISSYLDRGFALMYTGFTNNLTRFYFYDESDTPVAPTDPYNTGSTYISFTVPEGAKYLRISCVSGNIQNVKLYVFGVSEVASFTELREDVNLCMTLLKDEMKTTTIWGDNDSYNFIQTGTNNLNPNATFCKLEPNVYKKIKTYLAAGASRTFTFFHYDATIQRVIPFHKEILTNTATDFGLVEKEVMLDFTEEDCLSFTTDAPWKNSTGEHPGMNIWVLNLNNIVTKADYEAAQPYANLLDLGFSMEFVAPISSEDENIIEVKHTSSFFKGKKYVAYGDSITSPIGETQYSPYRYARLIGLHFGMETVNRGESGSVPTNVVVNNRNPNLTDANLAYVDSDTMLVTISGGQNAWVTAEDINSTDRATSIGAINYYIDQIRLISPKCVIVLCPTYIGNGDSQCATDYQRIAQNKHVGLAPTTDLNLINWEYDKTPKVLRFDNIHLTDYGGLRFAAVCIKYLEQMIL